MNAMIFAAGMGTRLKPITDIMPKALVPVIGKPLLEYVLEKIINAGAEHIVVNVHHFANQIEAFLNAFHLPPDVKIDISDESEKLLETGGGLKKALPCFDSDEPVLIHNVDILSNVNLREFYENSHEGDATLLVSERNTQRYLLFNEKNRLVGWTNIATGEVRTPYAELDIDKCKKYAFSGIHVISPSVMKYMEEWGDRFSIMDFYIKNCNVLDIRASVKDDLQLLDVGKQDTLEKAEEFLKNIIVQ